jgi:hypothetical protein
MRTRVFSILLGFVARATPSVIVAQRDAGPVVAREVRAADRRFAGFYQLLGAPGATPTGSSRCRGRSSPWRLTL